MNIFINEFIKIIAEIESNIKAKVKENMRDVYHTERYTERTDKWSIDLIQKIEWKRFEDMCAYYYRLIGYKANTTGLGADGGVDIKLYKNGENRPSAIVQCKAWNSYKVGVREVRELYGVMAAEKIKNGIFITSGKFTQEAREFITSGDVELIDGGKLLFLINRLPEDKKQELLNMATEGDYDVPTCPSCGIKMELRIARKGANAGNEFWGCRNYPRCKNILNAKRY